MEVNFNKILIGNYLSCKEDCHRTDVSSKQDYHR